MIDTFLMFVLLVSLAGNPLAYYDETECICYLVVDWILAS